MRTIFSTADVPRADAFAYWHDIACARIIAHESELVDPDNFYAELKAASLADLSLLVWTVAPVSGRFARSDDLFLQMPKSPGHYEFPDRSFAIDSGVLCLLDAREPIAFRAMEPMIRSALRIPREALERRIRINKEVANRPIAVHGDAALLAALMHGIIQAGPSTISPAAQVIVRDHVLDLLALALSHAGHYPNLASPSRVATLKLRAAIESQLANPYADRASIAAAAGVSERHGNRLLAEEGTSIMRLLIERRLVKCREALEDPQQQHRSVSDIAYAFGFRQLNHFTNAFMQCYGVSPADYRHNMASVRFQMRK
jgi:AraC family transcriptional regulator, positive regulator of tynA and feaB